MKRNEKKQKKLAIYLAMISLITLPVLGQAMLKQINLNKNIFKIIDDNISYKLAIQPLAPSHLFKKKVNIEDEKKPEISNKKEDSFENGHGAVSIVNFLNNEKAFRLLDSMA